MTLKKRTPKGTLISGHRPDNENYPGFWTSIIDTKTKEQIPICIAEYDSVKDNIQVVVYADTSSDEPTHIIPII